jgi:GxxExxY protein
LKRNPFEQDRNPLTAKGAKKKELTQSYTEKTQSYTEKNKKLKKKTMELNEITQKIIGCAIEVHKHLGPGLLESAYEECLSYELGKMGLNIKRQVATPVVYKETKLDCGYRIDILVENVVVIELKVVDAINPVHEAHILTYMKFSNRPIGLLINFNVTLLINGIKRYRI